MIWVFIVSGRDLLFELPSESFSWYSVGHFVFVVTFYH